MKIIVDTRENKALHVVEHFANQGIPFKLKKLHFGDYSIEGHENKIIVERKATLTELSGNFTKGRKQFEAEFIRATEAGAKIYLLIEDEDGKAKMKWRRDLETIKEMKSQKKYIINVYAGKMIDCASTRAKVEKFAEKINKLNHVCLDKYVKEKSWKSKFVANSMINSIDSWIKKYNINILFVNKEESGKVIVEIFQKYLAEVTNNEQTTKGFNR